MMNQAIPMYSTRPSTPFARLLGLRASGAGVSAGPASGADLIALYQRSSERIDGLSDITPVIRIWRHCPPCVWSFRHHGDLVGGIALLPLDARGLSALKDGYLDRTDPPLSRLVLPPAPPTAIYIWALLARGRGFLGLSEVLQQTAGSWGEVPIYASATTPAGVRAARAFGFEPVPKARHLQVLHREVDHD